MTQAELVQVPVPSKTDSYSPVSHADVINEIEDNLHKRNLYVSNRFYNTNRKGTQVIGIFDINANSDEFNFRLAFRNSYDKSMSLAFVAGTSVLICSNGMIFGEIQFVRRHTGTVALEMKNKIGYAIGDFNNVLSTADQHAFQMKNTSLDDKGIAELCGRFFMEQEIITSSQLNIIKDELKSPSYDEFSDKNLWSLYNHTTYALKENHPIDYIDRHQKLHNFIEKEFSLV